MTETAYPVELLLPSGRRLHLLVSSTDYILTAAYQAALDLPSLCLQGWCVTCAGRVLGGGDWNQSDSRRYYPEDRAAGFILLCTARPRSPLVIATHQGAAMRAHRIRLGLPVPGRLIA
ncbi:MAG: 2Fe-2S iron-sulfur cluster-binding protein [Terriglobales bacterium]